MPARFPAPISDDVRELLTDLLGREVDVTRSGALDLGAVDGLGIVAEYVTGEGDVGALCVVDSALALRCGAALSMVPATVADEAIERGDLPSGLVENWREVVNILAQLLNCPSTPHLRLQAIHPLPGELPAPVASLHREPAFRRDFEISIDGYGTGRFALLVA